MAITIHFDNKKQILIVTTGDSITKEEYISTMEEISTSTSYPHDVATLWDIRAFKFSKIVTEQLNQMISIRRHFPQRGTAKLAFVVKSNLAFGMIRMYEMLSSDLPQRMMVFRDMAKAEEWLMD